MRPMERTEAYRHIAGLFAEWFPEDGWTPHHVAEIDQRLAINDADIGDPLFHYADFALRVLGARSLGRAVPWSG